MTTQRRVTALIPARGGSKGVPGKNLRKLAGRSLLAWTIEAAARAPSITRIVVSTDDAAIAREARSHGAEVADRPAALATDGALVIDAIRYHIGQWSAGGTPPDVVVLLQPTSPLRTSDDVEACVRLLVEGSRYDSTATFCAAHTNPHRAWRLREETAEPFVDGATSWAPRQALPDAYELNGAVYAFYAGRLPPASPGPLFGTMGAVVMPRDRSVDIDDEFDLIVAEAVLQRRGATTSRAAL